MSVFARAKVEVKELERLSRDALADVRRAVEGYRELFAWTVREGVTNVLRHSRASRCTVTLSAAGVEVRDDGTGSACGTIGPGFSLKVGVAS